jgi:hypothetical protein
VLSVSAVRDGGEADDLASMLAMLNLLDAVPDLLEAAPDWARFQTEVAVHRRLVHEDHPCLRCGVPAAETFLSQRQGRREWRWLDLCERCGSLMRQVATRQG